tara:strand:- start:18116 stop:18871 length:756 start_codon:yes stop_codon:yes gene_type:complete
MKAAVLIKQVPDTTAKIDISGGEVDESGIAKWSISPYDEYALESALQMQKDVGATVVAITLGPDRASKSLVDAAAVGADELVHISHEGAIGSFALQTALAEAVKRVGADVVLAGKQAADTNAGSTASGVAKILNWPCVGLVSKIDASEGEFEATRSTVAGLERVSVSSPCVFAFDKGEDKLRIPNVRGIMMAKKKPVQKHTMADLEVDASNGGITESSVTYPPQKPPGQKFEGASSAPEVVSRLRDEANVI